jgi:serine protease AprX
MKLPLRSTVIGAAILIGIASPLLAGNPTHESKVDRAVHAALRTGVRTQPVIITVAPGCRASVRKTLERHGDVIRSEHSLIDALSVELHSDDVDALAAQPCVMAVSADAVVHAKGAAGLDWRNAWTFQPLAISSLGLTSTLRDTLGLPHYAALGPAVPTGSTGISVAIIDSGISPSENFAGRITGFYDFTKGVLKSTTPYDDYGHGTHIAGLIGSSGKLSNYEFQGVAPAVRLIGLKVLDGRGAGRTSDVIRAIEYVITNKARLNVQIINLSLGHPVYAPAADDPLVQAVEKASAAGLIVVTSAGNSGQTRPDGVVAYTGITSPGNAPSAITVGAAMTNATTTRADDAVAPYSSRGPTWYDGTMKPDVIAPGHQLASDTNVSSYLYSQLSRNRRSENGQPLLQLSGSSMAAGVTSGVVALILQAHNQNAFHQQKWQPVTPNLVKAILQYSAIPVGDSDYFSQGTGQINAAGAITLGYGIDTSQPIGSQWMADVATFTVVGGNANYWSQQIIYGDRVLQGALTSNLIVWGTGLVWGTATDEDNVVWGTNTLVAATNIVWGTSAVWANNVVWSNRLIGQRVDGTLIVWGTNIVWGNHVDWNTLEAYNIVWGMSTDEDNIVWGTSFNGAIIWGASEGEDNIVWGTSSDDEDNVVWGTDDHWGEDNIVWGTAWFGGQL